MKMDGTENFFALQSRKKKGDKDCDPMRLQRIFIFKKLFYPISQQAKTSEKAFHNSQTKNKKKFETKLWK